MFDGERGSSPRGANIKRDIVRCVLVSIWFVGIICLTADTGGAEVAVQDSDLGKGRGGAQGFAKEGELVFVSPEGTVRSKIGIEFAETPADREIGLMIRTELGETDGMLFLFPLEEFRAFWMKNTAIPLDIVFVSAQKRVVTIHQNTVPYAETSYESTEPAQYVVEVNAGFVRTHGIQVGDKIFWQRM
jgi:uncharacterized membrane protein (UPF0127 family)